MRCFRFRSPARRPPLLPRSAAIPRRRSAAEFRRRPFDQDPRLRRWAGPSRREMDSPERPPSCGKEDSRGSAAAAASAVTISPSVSPLTLSCVFGLFCAQDGEPGTTPGGEAAAATGGGGKGRIFGQANQGHPLEHDLLAAMPMAAPVIHRDRDVSIASASADPDHHGGGGGYRVGSVQSYRRISILGEGGFATVWKARDTRSGELVAIKSGKKAEYGAALLREAGLLAACSGNPAVVGLREVLLGPAGAHDVHIVMDFPGRSLRHLLETRGRLTESETRDAMRQLLAGVESIGAQGIVHGDLKPDNVLVGNRDDDGIVLILCDLGLAVSISELPRHIDGTLHYSAPEQLLGEKSCGPPVDAWALGCIMAELLTGDPPVKAHHATVQWTDIMFLLGVADDVTQVDNGMDASTPSMLRDCVPEDLLTAPGFHVLNGLLQYKPQDRLTPAEALNMPWFAD